MKGFVLGAGVTGLAAGIKTGFPVFEKNNKPGGLCRSYQKDGYHFEQGGGHWIFGEGQGRDFVKDRVQLIDYERKAGVLFDQIFQYPIQNVLNEESWHLPSSFKGWLFNKFGNDMCRMFFFPFNKKYTAGLYDDIIQDDPAKTPAQGGKGYNVTFGYPVNNLSGLIDVMASENKIVTGEEINHINIYDKYFTTKSGIVVEYDKLISTLPLVETLRLAGIQYTDLPFTSVIVLNVGGIRGKLCPKEHWLYIPNKEVPFFRVGFYSNVDQRMSPDGCVSMYIERAIRPGQMIGDGYIQNTIDWLIDKRWIEQAMVVDSNYIKYAYTWCNHNTNRQKYIDLLKQHSIYSTGRYGKWKFQGIVESIQDGLGVEL
jgi:protoporphyrinogen oxidase